MVAHWQALSILVVWILSFSVDQWDPSWLKFQSCIGLLWDYIAGMWRVSYSPTCGDLKTELGQSKSCRFESFLLSSWNVFSESMFLHNFRNKTTNILDIFVKVSDKKIFFSLIMQALHNWTLLLTSSSTRAHIAVGHPNIANKQWNEMSIKPNAFLW